MTGPHTKSSGTKKPGKKQRDEDKFDVTQLSDNAWKKRDKVCVEVEGSRGAGTGGKAAHGNIHESSPQAVAATTVPSQTGDTTANCQGGQMASNRGARSLGPQRSRSCVWRRGMR